MPEVGITKVKIIPAPHSPVEEEGYRVGAHFSYKNQEEVLK